MEFQSQDDSAKVNAIREPKVSSDKLSGQSSNSAENSSVNLKNDASPPHHLTDQISTIVQEALIFCKSYNRFYPITEEIPIILPDELRDKKKDIEFLKRWKELIPDDLLSNLRPWTL